MKTKLVLISSLVMLALVLAACAPAAAPASAPAAEAKQFKIGMANFS